MGFAQEMQHLGKQFETSFDDRMHFIGRNISDCKQTKRNTHRMMNRFHNEHKTMARKQRNDLHGFTENLSDHVDHLLGRFKKERMAFRRELENGHRSFHQSLKSLHGKRKNFFKNVKKFEQQFERKAKQ